MGLEMGLDLSWKNGLVMWASHVSTASRGKQMVSKERLKNWHQFWVINLRFLGIQFWSPNSIEPCFGTATEMAPIGSKNGAAGQAHFWCHIL